MPAHALHRHLVLVQQLLQFFIFKPNAHRRLKLIGLPSPQRGHQAQNQVHGPPDAVRHGFGQWLALGDLEQLGRRFQGALLCSQCSTHGLDDGRVIGLAKNGAARHKGICPRIGHLADVVGLDAAIHF